MMGSIWSVTQFHKLETIQTTPDVTSVKHTEFRNCEDTGASSRSTHRSPNSLTKARFIYRTYSAASFGLLFFEEEPFVFHFLPFRDSFINTPKDIF